MLLAIDVGNTQIKLAVFENNTLILKQVSLKSEAEKKMEEIFKIHPKIQVAVFASVGDFPSALLVALQKKVQVVQISSQTPFPFVNNYETPHTLGVDRMVLAAGATLQFPETARLVIDAGTCITYDVVDANNGYQGGAISPGLRLRYEALHAYTAKLPLLKLEQPLQPVGKSTAQSIHVGVVMGVVHEIEGMIAQYETLYPNLNIILTGGDAYFLATNIKKRIFANSNFLLESLNLLYNHNNT